MDTEALTASELWNISDEELESIVRELLADGEYIRQTVKVSVPRRSYGSNR